MSNNGGTNWWLIGGAVACCVSCICLSCCCSYWASRDTPLVGRPFSHALDHLRATNWNGVVVVLRNGSSQRYTLSSATAAIMVDDAGLVTNMTSVDGPAQIMHGGLLHEYASLQTMYDKAAPPPTFEWR